MAFAVEGFGTIAQNHISRNVASNFYPRIPFLATLAFFHLSRNKKNALNIGRPEGEVLSGKVQSPGETLTLQDFNSYEPRIQRFETSNTKVLAKYDTRPVVANPTTNAHSQAVQAVAKFNACETETPILIWHRDKDRALQKETREGQGVAMSRLIDEATEIAYQEHVKDLNARFWNGNPADQTADPWSDFLGILQALSATNTYGNVDRSDSSNSVWRAQVDSTLTSTDVARIIDDMNITKRLRTLGEGVNVMFTNSTLFPTFKAQALASSGLRMLPESLPGMAKWGVTMEVLQKDNCYIMYDETCPANTVLGFTMMTIRAAIRPGKNLTVSKFVDISDKSEGAKKADQAFITTEAIFSVDNPFLNVKYTAIGT